MNKKIILALFIIGCLILPSQASAEGLHFGIISAIEEKIDQLGEKKQGGEYEVELADNTQVLSKEAVQQLEKIEGSTYFFNKEATEIENLMSGDIIISTVGEGFLRKIVAIDITPDEYIVETAATTLEEAFENVNIELRKDLTPSDLNPQKAPMLRKGVSMGPPMALGGFYIELASVVLYDHDGNLGTKNDQIVANGSITFEPSIDFRLKIGWFSLKELKFIQTVQQTAEIEIESKVSVSFLKEVELAKYYFAAIPIGPIIFVPEISLVVGGQAQVSCKVTTGISQESTLSAGVEYNDGIWSRISDFSSEFNYGPPIVSAQGKIKGYVGPKLTFKIYSVVGPYVNVNGYLELDVQNPSWFLYGGLEGIGGVEMTILSFIKVGYEATLIDYKKLIASGTSDQNNPPNTPSSPSPADGATDQSINTDLSWTGGDPDSGDTVTYDVYFKANDSSPDVLVSDDQSETTYDPGTLNYDTHYYWKIITIDNHGVSSSGPVWSFTTARIIIPFASITLDGNPPEWGSIDPVCIDAQGDDNTPYTGADIKSFKFAQDSNYLYVMADFYDGIPNTALGQADLWAYQFHFTSLDAAGDPSPTHIDDLGIFYDGSKWDINYLSLMDGVSGSLTGSSVAVDSVIELKIPKNKLPNSFAFCLQIGTDFGIDGVLGDITEWKTLYQS